MNGKYPLLWAGIFFASGVFGAEVFLADFRSIGVILCCVLQFYVCAINGKKQALSI